jgi:hypothetical protein
MLSREISGGQAYRYAEEIARFNRIQGSDTYRAAALRVQELLERDGVAAEVIDFPARRGEKFLAHWSFEEWCCREAELWLLEQDGKRRLCRFGELELSLVQRSWPTPPQGVEAELVLVQEPEKEESYTGLDLEGKIALVRGNAMAIHALAVEKFGAMGLVFDNLNEYPPLRTRADMPDALQYTSFWWFGEGKPCFGFAVSPRVGDELRVKLQQGPVRLWAKVDSQFNPQGHFQNLEYLIPGKREEEILLVAHLCHPYPGAQDNASGPAVLMEVMRSLTKLIGQGLLPQPDLGIRMLLVPEMTGTYAYLSQHPRRKTLYALNLDMVGASQTKGGGPLCVEQPPLATPTFVDRFCYQLLESISKDVTNFTGTDSYSTCYYQATLFSGGSDHYILSDPTIGIPCPMLIQWPDRHYHTSLDGPDNLDPSMLARVALTSALYAWGLAAGSQSDWQEFLTRDIPWRYAYMTKIAEEARRHKLLGSRVEQVLDFYLDREQEALLDLVGYAKVRGFAGLEAEVPRAGEQLTRQGDLLVNWYRQQTGEKAELVGLDPAWEERVYVRTVQGPNHLQGELSRLSLAQGQWWREFVRIHNPGEYETFLDYWLDGKRTVAEVLELVLLESGQWLPAFAQGYLELCWRLGLVKLVG